MAASIPKVALLIESSRTYGRGILRGIARYARLNGPWSVYSQERELHSGIPAWLKGWKGDGIIARIENRRMAKSLLRLGHPVVDVLGNNRFEAIPGFDTDARATAQMAAEFFSRPVLTAWPFAAIAAFRSRIGARPLSAIVSRSGASR
jgi:LacI family transcriptional regulator